MKNFYWLWYGLTLWGTRLVLLCLLYFTDAPTGGPIVDRWYRFFPHTLVIEAGVAMAFALAGALICSLLRGRAQKIVGVVFLVLGGLYMTLAGTDDEIMRWMGQHFSISFVTTYALAASDMGLVGRVFLGGAWHFLLTAFIVVAGIVGSVILYKKMFVAWTSSGAGKPVYKSPLNWVAVGLVLALAITGLTSKNWFAPSNMRWKRISPVAFHLVQEISYRFSATEKQENYAEGIKLLGGNPDAEFPFWKKTEATFKPVLPQDSAAVDSSMNDAAAVNAAMNDSAATPATVNAATERPDVILFVIETFRGWTGDMRIDAACQKMPNICKLAKSGLYFPNAHSVGYPSIEGMLGTLSGLWAHPHTTFLSDYPNTQMISLPEILGNQGYYREVLTATEPSFDNLHPWFNKWFDYWEYKPENQHDVPIADRFRERYAARPADKPMFFDWMSTTSHVPYALPAEYGPTPKDMEVAYLRTLAYMDSAVGIVLDEVSKGPKADNTLFVIVGDHAISNNVQHRVHGYIGGAHDGYTWVPLIFAGPGIESRIVTNPVSQVDIAPTILDYLGINSENNFTGVSLLNRESYPPVFAFRMEDVAMYTDTLTYYAHMQDSTLMNAFETRLEPDWDTTHLVEGFDTGRPLQKMPANLPEIARQMRAAAHAWEYSINANKIMPVK